MDDRRTTNELKDVGAGQPAPGQAARFYHQAFAEFGVRALWHWRERDTPTITQASAIADSLRSEGNRAAWALAI